MIIKTVPPPTVLIQGSNPNLANTTYIKNVNTSPLQTCNTYNNIIPHSNQGQLHQQQPLLHQSEGFQHCSPYMHPGQYRYSSPNNLNPSMSCSTPIISPPQHNQYYQQNMFRPITKSGSGNLISKKGGHTGVVKITPTARCVKTKPHAAGNQKIVKVPPHPNKFLSPPKCLRMKKMVSDDEFGSNYFELSWKSQKKKRIRKRKQPQSKSNSSESSQKLVIQFHQETPLENHKESNSSDSSDGSSFLCLSTLHQETFESELNNIQHNQQQIEKPEDNCPWNALFPLKLVFDQ